MSVSPIVPNIFGSVPQAIRFFLYLSGAAYLDSEDRGFRVPAALFSDAAYVDAAAAC